MRLPATLTTPTNRPASSRTFLLASLALLLAAALQFATAWIQSRRPSLCAPGRLYDYYDYDSWREAARTGGSSSDNSGEKEERSSRGDLREHDHNWEDDYTWEGTDYPPTLPLPLGPPVSLTIEDSRHFSLSSPHIPAADADLEWHALYPGNDLGFVRLGPRKRFFSLALYHQLHCLASLREGILRAQAASGDGAGAGNGNGHEHGHTHAKRDAAHASHCLNYLRQTLLCAADLTLEPEITPGSGNVGEGLGVAHVCRDWGAVHEFARRNWEEWTVWQAQEGKGSERANGTRAAEL